MLHRPRGGLQHAVGVLFQRRLLAGEIDGRIERPAHVGGEAALRLGELAGLGERGQRRELGDGAVETLGKEFSIGQACVFHNVFLSENQ